MEISGRTEGQLLVVTVHEPRIDAAAAIGFKDNMRAQLDGGHPRVILDLHEVDFIDSSGLGAIVATYKSLGPDRSMTLAGLTPTVEKVFRLTRMDTVFSLFVTLEDALGALQA